MGVFTPGEMSTEKPGLRALLSAAILGEPLRPASGLSGNREGERRRGGRAPVCTAVWRFKYCHSAPGSWVLFLFVRFPNAPGLLAKPRVYLAARCVSPVPSAF